jgi:murein DD-endopeptidase MepM/ murein hydrolase activator NlpD
MWARAHTGLDFAAPFGTPIRSVSRGVVLRVGWAGAYGYRTVVRQDDGARLWYCHQSTTSVRPGQRVSAGRVIGRVGATGNVTGPHLHLEVRLHGRGPVDPQLALRRHGVRA